MRLNTYLLVLLAGNLHNCYFTEQLVPTGDSSNKLLPLQNEHPILELKKLPPPPFKIDPGRKRDLVSDYRSLTQTPLNEYAMLGDTVRLVCEAHAPPPVSRVLWYEFATADFGRVISDNKAVVPSHPNAARYRILQERDTQFILEISNVNINDGGTYACADVISGPPETYSGQAELIVLASAPNCTSTVPSSGVVQEGQNYAKSCQLNYRGGLNPTMYWDGPDPYQKTDIITQNEVFSGIAFTVDRSMDTRAFRCTTNFTAPTNTHPGVANNAPTYRDVHQFVQMFVS